MFKKYLGNNLRFYRMQKSISQQELAQLTGLHRTYISALEQGTANVTIDTIAKLASGLEISFLGLLMENTQDRIRGGYRI